MILRAVVITDPVRINYAIPYLADYICLIGIEICNAIFTVITIPNDTVNFLFENACFYAVIFGSTQISKIVMGLATRVGILLSRNLNLPIKNTSFALFAVGYGVFQLVNGLGWNSLSKTILAEDADPYHFPHNLSPDVCWME